MNKKKKEKDWKTEKARLESLSLEERRLTYGRSDYVALERIPSWRLGSKNEEEGTDLLTDKISLYKGDITILEVDAIVNAANSSLLGGGGVDGCIHKAAGPCLYDECHTLNGCDTGKAKITCGYDLPARYVIHTVGPVARGNVGQSEREDLTACYQNSLRLLKDNNLRTVAFPCISTGIYGFPNDPAAEIALKTVKSWIKENYSQVERVIFCVFLETDYSIYKEKIPHIFQDNNVNKEPTAAAERQDKGDGQPKEGNLPKESKDCKSKGQSGNSLPGDEDTAADVEMLSQKAGLDDVDMEDLEQDRTIQDEEKDVKGSTAVVADNLPLEGSTEKTENDNTEAARKRLPPSSEPNGNQEKDGGEHEDTEASKAAMEGVEEATVTESGPGSSGVVQAQGEGSLGSDLTQPDSTQSKEHAEKEKKE